MASKKGEILTLHLRGGQSVEFRAEKFTIVSNGFGTITKIKWEGWCEPQMMSFDPEFIDCATLGDA